MPVAGPRHEVAEALARIHDPGLAEQQAEAPADPNAAIQVRLEIRGVEQQPLVAQHQDLERLVLPLEVERADAPMTARGDFHELRVGRVGRIRQGARPLEANCNGESAPAERHLAGEQDAEASLVADGHPDELEVRLGLPGWLRQRTPLPLSRRMLHGLG